MELIEIGPASPYYLEMFHNIGDRTFYYPGGSFSHRIWCVLGLSIGLTFASPAPASSTESGDRERTESGVKLRTESGVKRYTESGGRRSMESGDHLTATTLTGGVTASGADLELRGPLAATPSPALVKVDAQIIRGANVLRAGTLFPVVILGTLDAGTATTGQAVKGIVANDVALSSTIFIPGGSSIEGWICDVQKPRKVLSAKLSGAHWWNAQALINIHFATIRFPDGKQFQISAGPAPSTPVDPNSADANSPDRKPQTSQLIVSRSGAIGPNYSGIKYGAVGAAIGPLSWMAGPFSMLAGTALSATTGAVAPSYAFDRRIAQPDAADRAKGFLVGAVKGLPGGFILTGVANHGDNVSMAEGTEIQVQLNSDLVIPNK